MNNIKYNYLIEDNLYNINELFILNEYTTINCICYHITSDSKYPFIQFMLEKQSYYNSDLLSNEFVLPSIIIMKNFDIVKMLIHKISQNLLSIGCKIEMINNNIFKGFKNDDNGNIYAFFDISAINIKYLYLSKNDEIWFSILTEIINVKSICNIPINNQVTQLFINLPELGILHNSVDNTMYPLPDVVYSGSEYKKTEFYSIFGIPKTKPYESCGKYFYFYRLFEQAVKEGGWVPQGGDAVIDLNNKNDTHDKSNTLIINLNNKYGKYMNGGINRYALFLENYENYIETSDELTIIDDDIETKYNENKCIILQFMNSNIVKPDILVKEYESFQPLSYHKLNMSLLGDKFDINKKYDYNVIL